MPRIALVAAALAALSLTSIDARAQYAPWCARDVRGGTNCGFHTYAQCMADLSGIGGTCSPNQASPGYSQGYSQDYRYQRRRQRY